MVLAIASTAMPFARSPEDQAERWLRVLRLHGEVGIALQELGVSEDSNGHSNGSVQPVEGDVLAEVTEHAVGIAARRGGGVTTVELLLAVMGVYGEHFGRVLEAHGTDCQELLDRLGVQMPAQDDASGSEQSAQATG
jgi:hypothetical protein